VDWRARGLPLPPGSPPQPLPARRWGARAAAASARPHSRSKPAVPLRPVPSTRKQSPAPWSSWPKPGPLAAPPDPTVDVETPPCHPAESGRAHTRCPGPRATRRLPVRAPRGCAPTCDTWDTTTPDRCLADHPGRGGRARQCRCPFDAWGLREVSTRDCQELAEPQPPPTNPRQVVTWVAPLGASLAGSSPPGAAAGSARGPARAPAPRGSGLVVVPTRRRVSRFAPRPGRRERRRDVAPTARSRFAACSAPSRGARGLG
jgi:hypothetical protein